MSKRRRERHDGPKTLLRGAGDVNAAVKRWVNVTFGRSYGPNVTLAQRRRAWAADTAAWGAGCMTPSAWQMCYRAIAHETLDTQSDVGGKPR